MKIRIFSFTMFSFILPLILMGSVYGQQSKCKVLLQSISGSYSGGCKKGLAHGKGLAQGVDRYEGQFTKGMPDGKGTYTWANGSVYIGEWLNGLKEGKGKMTYPRPGGDSIVAGYWKQDKFIGEQLIPAYKIVSNLGVIRYNFMKTSETGSDVTIKIFIAGKVNSDIEGFSMAYDSGNEYHSGYSMGIQNPYFPIDVKIRYRTWNQFHTHQSDVLFEFTIHDPGRWEISLNN
jgi:hypothetical protein